MLEQDRPWLDGYRRGDRRALERLYRDLSPLLLRFLTRLGVRPRDLDAAHQEAFLRIFGEAARLQYDGLKPFLPYALTIARFAAIDFLRGQGKVMSHAQALDDVQLVDASETPEEHAARMEMAALVQRFLSGLDAADRRFATARFIDGLSQEKAGELCGMTRQEARTREARLKSQCMTFFTEGMST